MTFTTGTACAYSCSFCYVENMMTKQVKLMDMVKDVGFQGAVVRREDAIGTLRSQLTDRHGNPKYYDSQDNRVIYASPLVDVAANMDLVRETIEACKTILELTHWNIRLLSKSNLLPKVAEGIPGAWKNRIIYGLSTGTLCDSLASSFEQGTPLVSKRLKALYELQDSGHRTFGMICPSLPQLDYDTFSGDMCQAIRADKCEHIWAEVLNVRGESMKNTVESLRTGGFEAMAGALADTSNKAVWEQYARNTFEAHVKHVPRGRLRFLQYVTNDTKPYWESRQSEGAILL